MNPIGPITLSGFGITLEPLHAAHAPDLRRAAAAPETFRWFTAPPPSWDDKGFAAYAQRLIDDPTIAPFAVRLDASGEIVGSTTYCDLRPAHRGVEVGWTWYAPAHRGSAVNPACKRLLLAHAFESAIFPGAPPERSTAVRVQLKTDERNAPSRAAILKLGATHEGVLRHHVVMPDGFLRSSAVYSILAAEWPGVRDALDRRLASFA